SDLVPTRLIDTAYLETASDDSLADFNNDGVPEMAVGRLPVRTSAEATTVVGKIIAFQNGELRRGALLVSDHKDGFDFEAANEDVRALLPSTMSVETVNRAGNDASVVRSQIIGGVNQGPLLVNYLGHGSVEMWTGAGILRTSDVSALTNKQSLSFFVMMTCLNGFAQDVYTESLAEALLRSGKGGAAAVWASSGLTEPDEQALMNRQLMRALFGDGRVTLGDAIISAKAATQNIDTRRTWMLFGDPTTRLR
ncbi:MAG TPA: C25 family cysteine peptidase, partial [Pyrinomonadaceae bacterium]|nr:C25 family cysteine peptidase [Pyrinomonadaceae bacterium]